MDQHNTATANLRHAMRIDPEALDYVPIDERLHLLLLNVVEHYEYEAKHSYGDVDSLFMVAALRYLLAEEVSAHYAIEVGVTLGDVDESAVNLKALIEGVLAR